MIDVRNKKSYSSSIVLIGNFSPAMFQPYWFKHCEILSDDEYNAVLNKGNTIVTEPLTLFETDNLAFRIDKKRFTIVAKKEPFELMLDTFDRLREKIDSVLIEKFGINFSFHLDLEKMENLKKFGDVIAPKSIWATLLSDALDSELQKSGLATLVMRKQTKDGCVNVKVESSANYPNSVYFDFNFHFEGDPREPFDILDVKETIDDHYNEYAEYAGKITQTLIEGIFHDGE